MAAGSGEGAASALSDAELADGGALDDLLSRQGQEEVKRLAKGRGGATSGGPATGGACCWCPGISPAFASLQRFTGA